MKIIWIALSNSRKTLSLSKKLIQDIGLCQKADVLLSDWVGCSDDNHHYNREEFYGRVYAKLLSSSQNTYIGASF